jgi:hypothetical protein
LARAALSLPLSASGGLRRLTQLEKMQKGQGYYYC